MTVMMRAVRRGSGRQGRDGPNSEYHCARSNHSGQSVTEHWIPFGYGCWWLVRVRAHTLQTRFCVDPFGKV